MIHQQVAVIATVLMVFVPFQVFGQVIYKVPCDYTTPSCECPLQFGNGTCIEVCEFEFEITNHYTFTHYQVNTTINTVATGGQLWIIVKIHAHIYITYVHSYIQNTYTYIHMYIHT